MAPALPLAPRDEPDGHDSLRRRALTSVDNIAIHMEEDDMGLPNQPSLAKDSQEMEQILVDLGGSDFNHPDLLQAIKTLESGGDVLSTGEPDAIFPLSGFDLTEVVDSEGDSIEDKIKATQARLERRCAFLQRRLRILQTRSIGKRISEEVVQTFEKCTRGARKDSGGRPMGLKAFLKRIETTAALQASAASKTVVGPKYYNAGTSKSDPSKSASIGIPPGTLAGLDDTAAALRSQLTAVKYQLDSDATASSSGAESNDEVVTYNNPHQQQMPIEKRALWSWQRARASIASRWCWLQAQLQELEYKIRQHNELHKQVREAKGAVEFEGEPAAYVSSLPGELPEDDDPVTETCARVRPLRRDTFKKRKLLQMHNLHLATPKAAKPSDINCSCVQPSESCPVCTGRAEPALAPHCAALSALSAPQRLALADPAYHPVLSHIKDATVSLHMSSLWSRGWMSARPPRPSRAPPPATHSPPKQHRRHTTRLKRGRPPLSRKIRERDRDEETSMSNHESSRSRGRPSTESRRRQSYDIDNIVIPQSVAASTRPQILTYKEIITPKWRVLEMPETRMNNGVSKTNNSNRLSVESEDEDISDTAVQARHTRAETRERSRWARKNSRRAAAAAATATDAPAGPTSTSPRRQDQLLSRDQSPAPVITLPPPQSLSPVLETVRPYTPRHFPLPDEDYHEMMSSMPEGYRHSSPEPSPLPPPPVDDEETSSLSPMSPIIYDGDDPDDAEWDPHSDKTERRKNAFR